MKLIITIFTFCAVNFYCSKWRAVAIIEDQKNFEKMTFDLKLRGSWKQELCTSSLLNCYEIVKADLMCTNKKLFSSMCAIQRDYCHNQWGMRDDYKFHSYQLYEKICLDPTYEWITRRFAHRVHLDPPQKSQNQV